MPRTWQFMKGRSDKYAHGELVNDAKPYAPLQISFVYWQWHDFRQPQQVLVRCPQMRKVPMLNANLAREQQN